MKPRSTPKASSSTFAIGATQFVVHDAFEMIECRSGSYASSFTPSTSVMSGSVAGAEMITFFAPASRCFCAPSRLVKSPVDSITTSTPSSRHGRFAGSRSASPLSSRPAALIEPSSADTPPANGPSTESYASRCAMVGTSPRSLNATSSNAASRSSDARKKLRPMRPKPLMPTLVFAIARMLVGGRRGLPGNRQRQAVDLADLVAEVTHVGLGVDPRRAGRALERLRRRELAAVAVQVLAQPLPQRSELAALELALEPGEVGGDPLPELHRDQ